MITKIKILIQYLFIKRQIKIHKKLGYTCFTIFKEIYPININKLIKEGYQVDDYLVLCQISWV